MNNKKGAMMLCTSIINKKVMDIFKLIVIFFVILIVMKLNKPLYISILFGSIATIILYGIGIGEIVNALKLGIFGKSTVYLVLAFYSITFLQRMLEKRGHLIIAEKSLTKLFNSRRLNAMIAPFVVGLLPSVGAILIASPIVDNAAGEFLDDEEKTFVTSYYRHISEAFLPTYASILLAINLSGVDMTWFVLAMLPMVILLFYIGYFFYVRKIPKADKLVQVSNKKEEILNLVRSLWTIILTIIIILTFKTQVYLSVIPVILLSMVINKFSFKELKPMFYSALEIKLILLTVIIMVFMELLKASGIIERLPYYFSGLAVSPFIIFGLIFFFGTLVAGSQAIIVIALPLAFATINDGGVGLLVLLMSMTYIAMQISPTHICLAVIAEAKKVSFISVVKKTLPVMAVFVIISSAYSYLIYYLL